MYFFSDEFIGIFFVVVENLCLDLATVKFVVWYQKNGACLTILAADFNRSINGKLQICIGKF